MRNLLIVFLIVLTSCSTETKTIIKYSNNKPKVSSNSDPSRNQFLIVCQVFKNGEEYQMPKITVSEDITGQINVCREIYLPQSWSHPTLMENEKGTLFTPSIPQFEEVQDFGCSIEISAANVKSINSKEWIHLQGKMFNSELEKPSKVKKDHETLQNYVVGYSTDTALFSIYIKDKGFGECHFKAGNNSYMLRFHATAVGR